MRRILHLPRVIYGCIFVTYGSRQCGRKSRTSQPCPRTLAAVRSSASCCRADGAGPRSLSTSSLSLSAAGSPIETASSHRRYQSRFHREALARVSATRALVRKHYGSLVKRDRQPSVVGGSEAEKRAWLSALHRSATLFSWNIDSIVCSSRNWSKPTNCWCPRYVGRLDPGR
jgi:ribosomal protein S10